MAMALRRLKKACRFRCAEQWRRVNSRRAYRCSGSRRTQSREWEVAEVGLVLLVEEHVLRGEAISNRLDILGECRTAKGEQENKALVKSHRA